MPKEGRKPKPRWPRTSPTRSDSRAIVDAVIEATSELPAAKVSMRLLAERAGVGIASIYRYFPTKQAIYAEISRRLLDQFVRDVEAVLAEDPPLDEAIRRVCLAAVVGQGSNTSMRRTLNLDVPQSWTHEASSAAFAAVVTALVRFVSRKVSPPIPHVEERVFWAFAALRGQLLLSILYPRMPADPARLVDEMTETALLLLFRPSLGGPP
jgi:AcrR family transcriptional regulator